MNFLDRHRAIMTAHLEVDEKARFLDEQLMRDVCVLHRLPPHLRRPVLEALVKERILRIDTTYSIPDNEVGRNMIRTQAKNYERMFLELGVLDGLDPEQWRSE